MEMKELISPHQAQMLMIALLFIAPAIGLICGALAKRIVPGLLIGLAIGIANFALWTIYNAITNSLGLDTVKNLLVNLALFIVIGAIVGGVIGARRRGLPVDDAGADGNGGAPVPATAGGGSRGRAPGAARSRKEAQEPPRNR